MKKQARHGPMVPRVGPEMDGIPRVRRSNGNVRDECTRRAKHFIWHIRALHKVFGKTITTIKIDKGQKGAPTEGATALRPHPPFRSVHRITIYKCPKCQTEGGASTLDDSMISYR